MQELIVARITDGGVLGRMNDMAVTVRARDRHIRRPAAGRPRRPEPALRRNINAAHGYQRPVDLATRRMHSEH
ncbi:MAG TPA: hypothetical protein VF256_03265 [Streptosporangiaceae bacterium]|jgi:hypothetical protein